MGTVRFTGARLTRVEREPEGLRVSFNGFLVPPLPDLSTASLAELRAAEWSGREPCKIGDGAWHVCQGCGLAKIDQKGHAPGCIVAEAIERAEREGR